MGSFNTYQPTDIEPGHLNCWDCKYDCNCEEENSECKANCIYNNEVWHYKECFQRRIQSLDDLFGRKVKSVTGCHKGSEYMEICFTDGLKAIFEPANYMANVEIEDVNGDPQGMVGNLITLVEVISDLDSANNTWTYYRFATLDGYIDIRWFGSSNGYYSEKVNWYIKDENDEILARSL